jgi:hypothetical protein
MGSTPREPQNRGEARLGQRRLSLHNGASITANQLRQRAEAVKADPNLFGSLAKRVALTVEHAAARSWPIDQPIRPKLVMLNRARSAANRD